MYETLRLHCTRNRWFTLRKEHTHTIRKRRFIPGFAHHAAFIPKEAVDASTILLIPVESGGNQILEDTGKATPWTPANFQH